MQIPSSSTSTTSNRKKKNLNPPKMTTGGSSNNTAAPTEEKEPSATSDPFTSLTPKTWKSNKGKSWMFNTKREAPGDT